MANALLLETGDALLLETGDRLLLDQEIVNGVATALLGGLTATAVGTVIVIVGDMTRADLQGSHFAPGPDAQTSHWRADLQP